MKTKFKEIFSKQAELQYDKLNKPSNKKIYDAVTKAIYYLVNNTRHPSLGTHIFHSLTGANDEKVFVAYAQQNTASAYRILWHYGPNKNEITIVAIIPHPNH